jgi:tetratricopeptide (TPR) repeat protein
MPSIGYALIAGWFFSVVVPGSIKSQRTAAFVISGMLLIILSCYSAKSIARNRVWKDDFTLFTTDVKVSENSTKCNTSAGGQYYERGVKETDSLAKEDDFNHSLKYLNKALEIYPENKNCLLLLGNVYGIYKKDFKGAIREYLDVIHLDGYNENAFRNALVMLERMDNSRETDYKIGICRLLYGVNPDDARLNYMLGKLYGQFKGNLDSALIFLEKSVTLAPGEVAAYKDLGVIYGMKKDYENSLRVFKKAAELAPDDAQVRENLAITYQLLNGKK